MYTTRYRSNSFDCKTAQTRKSRFYVRYRVIRMRGKDSSIGKLRRYQKELKSKGKEEAQGMVLYLVNEKRYYMVKGKNKEMICTSSSKRA